MKPRPRARRYLGEAGLVFALVAADQLTKHLIARRLWPGQRLVVIPRLLNLTPVHNTGGIFGLLSGKPLVVAALSLVAIGLLVFLFTRLRPRLAARLAAVTVLAGAVGNLIDRFRYGYVLDFVDLHWGPWHWYVFNVADAAITVGALALVAAMAREELRKPTADKAPAAEKAPAAGPPAAP